MENIDMVLFLLLLIILILEIISNRTYQKEINECYRVLLQQQHQINELESKLKKSD